jgi:hypothetical protein
LGAAQDGIGDLVVHLDAPCAGKGEGVRRFGGAGAGEMGVMGIMGVMGVMRVRRGNRAGVAEQAAEDVGEEVRECGCPLARSFHWRVKGTSGEEGLGSSGGDGLGAASYWRDTLPRPSIGPRLVLDWSSTDGGFCPAHTRGIWASAGV